MSVKRRFSTRWGHPYHRQGACTECRQTLLHPLCSITPMTPEGYTEYSAQSKREDTPEQTVALALDTGDVSPVSRLLVAAHCPRDWGAYPDQLPLVLVAAQCRPVLR